MKESRIVTADDMKPNGLRCPYCDHDFSEGEEQVSVLEAITEDAIPIYLVMCPACADRSDDIVVCETCHGTGAADPPLDQCPICKGAGDLIPGARSVEHQGADE